MYWPALSVTWICVLEKEIKDKRESAICCQPAVSWTPDYKSQVFWRDRGQITGCEHSGMHQLLSLCVWGELSKHAVIAMNICSPEMSTVNTVISFNMHQN